MLLKINNNLYINPDEIVSITKQEEDLKTIKGTVIMKKDYYYISTKDMKTYSVKDIRPRVFEYLEC